MKFTSQEITRVALFAALLCMSSLVLKFGGEMVVPFSIQTLLSLLTGAVLGSRLGALSVGIYVLIGLLGLPVFAQPPYGGVTYLFQPSFGFLPGFILGAFVVGRVVEGVAEPSWGRIFLAMLIGIVVIYVIGVPYLYGIFRFYLGKPLTFGRAIELGMLPFLALDLAKGILAAFVAKGVIRRIRR